MLAFLFLALIAPANGVQEVTPLEDGRIRVRIVFDDLGASGHMRAQRALAEAAVKACQGKGRAVSEGVLELNKAEPLRKNREALELREVYRCVPKGG